MDEINLVSGCSFEDLVVSNENVVDVFVGNEPAGGGAGVLEEVVFVDQGHIAVLPDLSGDLQPRKTAPNNYGSLGAILA